MDKKMRIRVFPKVHVGMIRCGAIDVFGRLNLGNTWPGLGYYESQLKVESDATLVVKGNFDIYSGFLITVNDGGTLILGSGFINYRCNIACFNRIEIGDDVAISENVVIRDSDNHRICNTGYVISKPIKIMDHVWIGMNSTVLKGVTIGEGSIIAAGAVVTKDVPSHCLVAGVPARIIRRDVSWKN
ncbi:acyltransferase [Lactiplantibacillus daoliensis]|nr:acyltransferase [Lactiplantibacillus daoliensis]